MCDKIVIFAYILKIIEKDPFLSLQMRAKKMFNLFGTIFTFFIITNFKTDRYLNNFQEHLIGILRLRKY